MREATIAPKIGLVLGSGGARGWCHIGALREFLDLGIEPDVIAGSSMGAFVGAAYAVDALDGLEEWARTLNWHKMTTYIDINITNGGLIGGKYIADFLNKFVGDQTIETLKRPFTAVASDFITGREVWLQQGPLVDAVRASIALPGIFSPIKRGDSWLIDGGITNPVPVSACRAMGADIIIAVNPNATLLGPAPHPSIARRRKNGTLPNFDIVDRMLDHVPSKLRSSLPPLIPEFLAYGRDTPGYFDVVTTAIDIMTNQIMRSRLAGDPPHVMVNPRLGHMAVLEFNRAEEAIEEGRNAVKRVLSQLQEYLSCRGQ